MTAKKLGDIGRLIKKLNVIVHYKLIQLAKWRLNSLLISLPSKKMKKITKSQSKCYSVLRISLEKKLTQEPSIYHRWQSEKGNYLSVPPINFF